MADLLSAILSWQGEIGRLSISRKDKAALKESPRWGIGFFGKEEGRRKWNCKTVNLNDEGIKANLRLE